MHTHWGTLFDSQAVARLEVQLAAARAAADAEQSDLRATIAALRRAATAADAELRAERNLHAQSQARAT